MMNSHSTGTKLSSAYNMGGNNPNNTNGVGSKGLASSSSAYNKNSSSYMQQDLSVCPDHPTECITNFCSCAECLRPLCPECVTIHNQHHKQQSTYAEIETIRAVRTRCETKLVKASEYMEQSIAQFERTYLTSPAALEEKMQQLRQYRRRIDEIVDTHFRNLEEKLLANNKEIQARNALFQPTFSKMRQVVGELDELQNSLNQKSNIDQIRRVCVLDVQSIGGKFKAELNKTAATAPCDNLEPRLDDQRFYYLAAEFERVLYLQVAPEAGLNGSGGGVIDFSSLPTKNYPNEESAAASAGAGNGLGNLSQAMKVFPVDQPDYFEEWATRKFLHFFQNDDNKLHFIELQELDQYQENLSKRNQQILYNGKPMNNTQQPPINQLRMRTIDLMIHFKIPYFHKSIATPSGELFLTGGTIPDGSVMKSGQIYQFDWTNSSLKPLGNMYNARSSHGIAFLAGKIYVVGGYEHKHVMTKRCERFNLTTRKWEVIASLNHAASSLSLSSFSGAYLYKFGGIGDAAEQNLLSPYIERYDVKADAWTVIDPKLAQSHRLQKYNFNFGLLSTSASVQISQKEIFVFGGYHEDNSGSNQSFILSYEDAERQQQLQQQSYKPIIPITTQQLNDGHFIKEVNIKPLPRSEAFWNNQPIIHKGKIYALQNIAGENSDNCLENERRILLFNQKDWVSLN